MSAVGSKAVPAKVNGGLVLLPGKNTNIFNTEIK
jgi:hypothetical protein